MSRLALKFLNAAGCGPYSGFAWPTPTAKRPGRWVKAKGSLVPCRNGVHAATLADAPHWLNAQAWLIELDGRVIESDRKLCARRGRLVRRLDLDLMEFAVDCAERVLPIFETARPGDGRPRAAIEAARSNATASAVRAAHAAAAAAHAAAAAAAAARAAAYAAAAAVYAAAYAASASSYASYASDANLNATYAIYHAAAAAPATEHAWQADRLAGMLGLTDAERKAVEG